MSPERDSVEITSREEWRAWLGEHHDSSDGVWVVTLKKSAGGVVSYEDLVLEGLCFGWVDSQAKGVDERRTSITFTPRRARSRWTQPNRDRVEGLEASGLMTDAGRAVIAQARSSGTWDELRPVEALEVPDDLAAAIDRTAWEAKSRSWRYAELLRLHDTKRPETRAKRVAAIAAAL